MPRASSWCPGCGNPGHDHGRHDGSPPNAPPKVLKHRMNYAPGAFTTPSGVAVCGALRVLGAKFSAYFRLVTCPDCRRIQRTRQLQAKQRLAEVESRS